MEIIEIKDIVNHEVVNLTNCEGEPIHIPGSIQPHGFLIGLKTETWLIDFCSANTRDFIQLDPEVLLGRSLRHIFSKTQSDAFTVYFNEGQYDVSKPFIFELNGNKYNTTVNRNRGILILELEPFPDGTLELPDLFTQTRGFISLMEKHSYLSCLCKDIADETRRLTGYDRVMIYRFDEEYNGEVTAESKRDDLQSFFGQKYPHTDIPVQARELYVRNPLRMIADINYQPVPILTLNDDDQKSNKSLDLSMSILRSVSPIHVEYLKNMGVGATLTISLLQNRKLWGLIACHHYSPRIIPHYTRLSALLQGHFLTSQIAVREAAEEYEISKAVDKSLLKSLELLHEHENFIEAYHHSPYLLQLANASGFVVYHKGKLYKNGRVPSNENLIPLLKLLSERYPNGGFHTSNLLGFYPDGEKLSQFAAGIIYHSITADTPDGILWLRAERQETINWAGNPDKSVIVNDPGGMRLSPRKSFELWKEIVKNKSASWRKSELNCATAFAYALQKHINLRFVKNQESNNRLLNEELKAANKELVNLNWIGTHDLKEPLRKIQIFASKVLENANADLPAPVKDAVERMRFAAEKMQLLIEDILTYSKTGSMEKSYVATDLNLILKNVLGELHDNIREKETLLTSGPLPTLNVIPFQIHQLFVNLISNALKFSKKGVTPVLRIEIETVNGAAISNYRLPASIDYHAISFQDNGIGFEKEYENRIFEVFQRLHPANKFPGTGIGLAICKKIMENHSGFITADSELGKGARFTVYFPKEEAITT